MQVECRRRWGDPTGGLLFFGPDLSPFTSFIQWSDDFSGLYDLGIGSSLGGFSFLSSQRIDQPITFALNGTTDFATAQDVSGVPEPASFLLLLPVIAGLIVFRIRSKFGSNTVAIDQPFGEGSNEVRYRTRTSRLVQ
jgi:hypothetical protein